MNPRRVAIALSLMCAAGIAMTVVFWFLGATSEAPTGWGTYGFPQIAEVQPIAFAAVGAVITFRQPANRIGWVCLAIGLVLSLDAGSYGGFGRTAGSAPLPGAEFATWLGDWEFLPGVGSVTFLLLLFPTGRLLSPRWRGVAWGTAAVIFLAILSEAFHPGALAAAPSVDNPYPIEASKYIPGRLPGGANVFLAPCFAAGAVCLVLRFRRATGRERLQIKWFASAAALLAMLFLLAGIGNVVAGLLDAGRPLGLGLLEDLVTASVAGMPIAIGIAVLRHDLYEIDVVINRTLVYAALTATLAAAYLSTVLLFQLVARPLTNDSNLAIAVSTLAVAALFRPARARIQSAVDRRFYRHKYDAQRTLEAFSSRLRDEVGLSVMRDELRGAVVETMQPAHVSLWLREDDP